MTTTLHTVGHSNRDREAPIELLQGADIEVLVDVRARPYSRRYPYFPQEPLRAAIEAHSMTYYWAGRQLGGLTTDQSGGAGDSRASVRRKTTRGLSPDAACGLFGVTGPPGDAPDRAGSKARASLESAGPARVRPTHL